MNDDLWWILDGCVEEKSEFTIPIAIVGFWLAVAAARVRFFALVGCFIFILIAYSQVIHTIKILREQVKDGFRGV